MARTRDRSTTVESKVSVSAIAPGNQGEDGMGRDRGSAIRRRLLLPVLAGAVMTGALFASSAKADWVWNVGYLWNASAPFSVTVESHTNATLTQWLAQSASAWSQSCVVSVSVGSSGKIALSVGY